jgi:hypothetical protein
VRLELRNRDFLPTTQKAFDSKFGGRCAKVFNRTQHAAPPRKPGACEHRKI